MKLTTLRLLEIASSRGMPALQRARDGVEAQLLPIVGGLWRAEVPLHSQMDALKQHPCWKNLTLKGLWHHRVVVHTREWYAEVVSNTPLVPVFIAEPISHGYFAEELSVPPSQWGTDNFIKVGPVASRLMHPITFELPPEGVPLLESLALYDEMKGALGKSWRRDRVAAELTPSQLLFICPSLRVLVESANRAVQRTRTPRLQTILSPELSKLDTACRTALLFL